MTCTARLLSAALLAVAGAPLMAQARPAPRALGPVLATSAPMAVRSFVLPLSNGRVLVMDYAARALVMLDANFANPIVVLDSNQSKPYAFPPRMPGPTSGLPRPTPPPAPPRALGGSTYLLPFRGDSALWFDGWARRLLVIGPDGRITREFPTPTLKVERVARSGPGGMLVTSSTPSQTAEAPLWSESLGFIFMMSPPFGASVRMLSGAAPGEVLVKDDSMTVFRWDYTAGRMDSLTAMGRLTRVFPQGPSSYASVMSFSDVAVVTTDGSLVVFHARDYRFEWIGANGAPLPSAPVPYEWRRIADRQLVADSITKVRLDSLRRETAMRDTGRVTGPPPSYPRPIFLPEIPDRYPPTFFGVAPAVLADADNHVWIQDGPADTPDPNFRVWSVISRTQGIVDRVRIPQNHTVAGFGPGVVYLVAAEGDRARIERVRIK
jgi:hypothetical protein